MLDEGDGEIDDDDEQHDDALDDDDQFGDDLDAADDGDNGDNEEGDSGAADEAGLSASSSSSVAATAAAAASSVSPDTANANRRVLWIFRRLSYLCSRPSSSLLTRRFIFCCFAALATQMGGGISPYLLPLFVPLYRCVSAMSRRTAQHSAAGRRAEQLASATANEDELALQQLAGEVLELIKQQCGNQPYLQVLNTVRTRQRQKRAERQRTAALERMLDPARVAEQRARKQSTRAESRSTLLDDCSGVLSLAWLFFFFVVVFSLCVFFTLPLAPPAPCPSHLHHRAQG